MLYDTPLMLYDTTYAQVIAVCIAWDLLYNNGLDITQVFYPRSHSLYGTFTAPFGPCSTHFWLFCATSVLLLCDFCTHRPHGARVFFPLDSA